MPEAKKQPAVPSQVERQTPASQTVRESEAPVFRREFTIPARAEVTDCSNAVELEAIQLGHRPVGKAKVESTKESADGKYKVVTWAVQVQGRK
jgi:hypothetical protein